MAQKKLRRKDLLKKPDEFITTTQRAINWVLEHRRLSIIVACCFILAIMAGVTAKILYASHQKQKRLAFQQAVDLVALPDKSDQAIKALESFLKKYRGSDLDPLARISLGRLYFDKGRYGIALHQYDEALKQLEDRPEFLPLAALGKSFSLEALGKVKEAIGVLVAVKDNPANYLREETLFQLTRLYYGLGATDKCKASGEELLQEFPSSPYGPLVRVMTGKE